ncbi:hypothetical protein INT47_005198 [Mucor saturninus]|uniref:JmjN domain-containing protein n=1 Tax=Mucor saturninus TaxID=64648 RepID=A0A8H7V198_9FUNG|nr:hypothetical protein INT47_005198 [Mucor saturninus]
MATDGGLPFDLSTVKTKADEDHVRKNKRIFGIKEAPTFYPTREEFKDPLSYIEKISLQGKKYGIIKIVLPKEYKPGLCTQTMYFHVKRSQVRLPKRYYAK